MSISYEQWHALRKNISNIVNKHVSIHETKTIVAIIHLMDSVGVKYNMAIDPAADLDAHVNLATAELVGPFKRMPTNNDMSALIEMQEAQIKENMRFIAANTLMSSQQIADSQAIKFCVQMEDYQVAQMKLAHVASTMGMELAHRIAVHLSKYRDREFVAVG